MEPLEETPIIYTMENKPIVTCAGDQTLFTSLYSQLTQQLPREPMEWKRSYGRAPKMIHLEANFVLFKEDLLPKEANRALLTFPFLHIYWTKCCDTEVYRASVKQDILRWQRRLRLHGATDWLIVVVENDSKKKNKTNILPRAAVVDKIRNDFCTKQSNRCAVLLDPLKDSPRAQESWSSLLSQLRALLSISFRRNLGRFEDDMRTLREKRTQPGWSFYDFFMVQEELAFVFEMLQQFEDALVQYDELDALFTQYILNLGAGDGVDWLGGFCAPLRSWTGLVLRRPIDMEMRELIQSGRAVLLELRSYLFARQCTLLILLQRPWEVTQRALELLQNCAAGTAPAGGLWDLAQCVSLQVPVQQGALDCWVFLSCLEVLQRIEGCCERAQLEANCSHTVGLWAYASEKLKSLGSLCGLSAGEWARLCGPEQNRGSSNPQSPYKTLKEALSSVEAFEKHYLDLTHAAMEMYRAIGRMRSARLVGKTLAEFYMRKGDPRRAEGLLQDALSSYEREGWALPVTHTRKQLAECQRLLNHTEEYLQTSSLLAADANLMDKEREHFCQEILAYANQASDSCGQQVALNMSAFAQLQQLQFCPTAARVHKGAALQVELRLCSLMPVAVSLEQLSVSVHFSLEQGGAGGVSGGHRPEGVVSFPQDGPPALELHPVHDRSPSDDTLNSVGVACRNVHLLMQRRPRSSASPDPLSHDGCAVGVAIDDSAQLLKASGVVLSPGNNSILFTAPTGEPGTYTLRQMRATVGRVQFILPHIHPVVRYEVYTEEPEVSILPLSESLLAGLPQRVQVTVVSGRYSIKKGDALQLSNMGDMCVLNSAPCSAHVLSGTGERVSECVLSVQCSERVTSISLPVTPPYHTIRFYLDVLCQIPATPPRPETQRPTNGEPHRRAKHQKPADRGMAAIEQKVSVGSPWSVYSILVVLTFHVPFKSQHALLSAGKRKYIQVCMQNVSELDFLLAEPSLTERSGTSLELQSLNAKTQLLLCRARSLSFLWELRWSGDPPLSPQCCLSTSFSPANSSADGACHKPYRYEFQLENLSTLYSVKAQISPGSAAQDCHTGALCVLEACITRLPDLCEDEKDCAGLAVSDGVYTAKLLYEVVEDSRYWAVCGKSSGQFSLAVAACASHTVQVEVMPLSAGNLLYPDVRLFKYLPHRSVPVNQTDTDCCLEKDSVSLLDDREEDAASLHSRGSVLSLGATEPVGGPPLPRLEPFGPGQVFNTSRGRQVLVLPTKDDHVLDVSIT
ncbi:hypothetical protein GJAV_G00254590 [Gymnothorax javanicus]|nr:hypothetical protein GJAV_G00254590 [Gymnothorax javanicus]